MGEGEISGVAAAGEYTGLGLGEAILSYISVRKRHPKRPYAVRKPKEYPITVPGDLVELDTLDVRPLPGVVFKHF